MTPRRAEARYIGSTRQDRVSPADTCTACRGGKAAIDAERESGAVLSKEMILFSDSFDSFPEIMTVPDVARYLRISKSAAYELVRKPDFPAFRINSSIRIRRESFFLWVTQQESRKITKSGQNNTYPGWDAGKESC